MKFTNIKNTIKKNNILNSFLISKAYTEGIYADTPANRKLGRVGMTYAAYAEKLKNENEEEKQKIKEEELKEKNENYKKIKESITSQFNSLKKTNDYINISTEEGHTIRFQRNQGETNHGVFTKAFIKSPEGKMKSFENSSETALIESVSIYTSKLGLHIIDKKEEKKEEVDENKNKEILSSKMKKAKEDGIGTITIQGSGDLIIYMNRKRQSRWLKDFEAYTIRDSKKNVINKGSGKTEEEVLNKLNTYLKNNKITLKL